MTSIRCSCPICRAHDEILARQLEGTDECGANMHRIYASLATVRENGGTCPRCGETICKPAPTLKETDR